MAEARSTREALAALALEEVEGLITRLENATETMAELQRSIPVTVDLGVAQIRQASQASADSNRKTLRQTGTEVAEELQLIRRSAQDVFYTHSRRVQRQMYLIGAAALLLSMLAGAIGGYIGAKTAIKPSADIETKQTER